MLDLCDVLALSNLPVFTRGKSNYALSLIAYPAKPSLCVGLYLHVLIGIKIHEKRTLPEIDFLSFLFCELSLSVKNLRRRIGFEYFAAMRQLLASGWSCVRMNKPRNVRVERFEWQACLDRRNGSTGPIAEVHVQLVQYAGNSFAESFSFSPTLV